MTQTRIAARLIPAHDLSKAQRFIHRISDINYNNVMQYEVVQEADQAWLVSQLAENNLSNIIQHCKRDNQVLPFDKLLSIV